MANFTVKVCYPNWLKIASIVCHVVSYSSRTERLLTRQSWLKTGLPPTAVTSSEKMNGHRTHRTSTLLAIISVELCFDATRHFNPSQMPSTSWRMVCSPHGTICHRTLSKKAILNIVKKPSSLCESWGRTLSTRLEINCFHSFELGTSDVFFWFQYKHYDENCDFHSQFLHGSVVA